MVRLEKEFVPYEGAHFSCAQLLRRPELTYAQLRALYPNKFAEVQEDVSNHIELNLKYAGYIKREEDEVARLADIEKLIFQKSFDFKKIVGLKKEAMEKLLFFSPRTLGQASRIAGVSHADIQVLMVAMKKPS